jgi:hydroxymethylglutaryl-CoA synthase
MFSISISKNAAAGSPLDLLQKNVQSHMSLLSERLKITPEEFDRRMKEREEGYGQPGFVPKEDVSVLFPGTYYLTAVDDKFRRTYSRKPLEGEVVSQKKVATPVTGLQGLQINGNGY